MEEPMPLSSRQIKTTERLVAQQGAVRAHRRSGTRAGGMLVLGGGLAAGASWFIVRWLASQLNVTPGLAGIGAFCAAWTALYPFARLNRASAPWSHWARGALLWQRIVVIAGSFGAAAIAAFTAYALAPPAMADIAAVCAIWVALSPFRASIRESPWWMHWVQGAFILLGFWIVTRAG
ncbi:MAG: hypothetical protein LC753_03720 [Acidobacteria bacterium]|nr:hypothetical protein [Acidobacteriota bacterium]